MRIRLNIPLAMALAAACASSGPRITTVQADTGRVEVPGSSLFYERAGAGTPVILLHPGYLDRRTWDPQFAELARQHLVVRYDARGLGRSGPARSSFSQAEDLHHLLLALGLTHVSLVGCSLGGATALDFAVTYPQMVDRLILVAPGLPGYSWSPESLQAPWRVAARAALARGDTVGVAQAWLLSAYLQPASRDAELAATLRRLLGDNVGYWKGLLADQQTWDTEPAPPTIARLREVRAPTLLILGTADTPEILQIGDTLMAQLPHITAARLPDVGHLPNMEQPKAFLALIRPFLSAQ